MNKITRNITVPISVDRAFHSFVDRLGEWWPAEYTWSQDQLQRIAIEGREGGLCSEVGPYGFRCDWGRVTAFETDRKISFTWQISPQRVPEPDPSRASNVNVSFNGEGAATSITFEHTNFEKHGEGAKQYQEAMASDRGWDYILEQYKAYCERSALRR